MSKRAEEAANKDFEGRFDTDDQTVIWFMDKMKHSYIKGYEQAEEDIISIIQKRHDNLMEALDSVDDPRSKTARDLISRAREDSKIIELLKKENDE